MSTLYRILERGTAVAPGDERWVSKFGWLPANNGYDTVQHWPVLRPIRAIVTAEDLEGVEPINTWRNGGSPTTWCPVDIDSIEGTATLDAAKAWAFKVLAACDRIEGGPR